MSSYQRIDTSFDVRQDTPPGKDPDAKSPTLRRYHQLLWDKPLPTGNRFTLIDTERDSYLHHRPDRGEFWMTSDAVVHTYRYWSRFGLPEIVRQIPGEVLDRFDTLSYTIGGMLLFPSWTGTPHWSINQARGMLTHVADRMDLTLEAIRRYYVHLDSPLTKTLDWYGDFFALFGDFENYVEFFLLDDLLTEDRSGVRFFLPFDDFVRIGTPADASEYRTYMKASIDFLTARNARIDAWTAGLSGAE